MIDVHLPAFLGAKTQWGFVVHDLEAAARDWTERLGVGPFVVIEDPVKGARFLLRGRPIRVRMSVAFSYLGDTMIELIQQHGEDDSPYAELRASRGEGLHHIAFWPEDFAGACRRLEAGGLAPIASIASGDDPVSVMYYEAPSSLGMMLEIVEMTAARRRLLRGFSRARRVVGRHAAGAPLFQLRRVHAIRRLSGARVKVPLLRSVSLCWLTIAKAGHLELIDAAGLAGFGAVGMKLVPRPTDTVRPLVGDRVLIAEVRAALRHHGLAVLEMGGVWLTPDFDSGVLAPALELGAELGARYVIAVGTNPDPAQLQAHLHALAEQAAQFGIGTAVEFAPYTRIPSLAAAIALVTGIGRRDVGVLVDALHLHRSGGTEGDLAGLPEGSVPIFHLCDCKLPPAPDLAKEGRSARLYPGAGELPLLSALMRLPPGTALEVEAPCAAFADLPVREQALRAAAATEALLTRHVAERALTTPSPAPSAR